MEGVSWYLDFIHFNWNVSFKTSQNLQRGFKILRHAHFRLDWGSKSRHKYSRSSVVNKDWEKPYLVQLTSHRGDSGMKKSPGISIVHGSIPVNKTVPELHQFYLHSDARYTLWQHRKKVQEHFFQKAISYSVKDYRELPVFSTEQKVQADKQALSQ